MRVPMEPERLPDCLAGFEGRWVAVRDREVVVADAATPLELADKLKALGDEAKRAVVQYVPGPDEPMFLGWMSL